MSRWKAFNMTVTVFGVISILLLKHVADGLNIRLVNGSRPSEGRLEVFYNNAWGTVCDDYFDTSSAAAKVVCRMLGFTGNLTTAAAKNGATYGQGIGPILLDDVRCNGTESSLSYCHANWTKHNCGHSEDVGVDCGFNIRLVNGSRPNKGRLEVFYNNSWGTVCDDGFNSSAALVVCRTLGFTGNLLTVEVRSQAADGQGTGRIWLQYVGCSGNESTLFNCQANTWGVHNCGHYEDVGVDCDFTPDIRLVNGSRNSQGRLEVFYDNRWGTVCDDEFNSLAATVVCRMLGFTGNQFVPAVLGTAIYGQGTGPIWLDDVTCNGTESSLINCRINNWSKHNCDHSEDVGVDCKCGGVLTDPYGEITSPNFPLNYINNIYCSWSINAPEASRINVNFTEFAMESAALCKYDYLELFNGPNASSLSIGKYCGAVPPMGFKSQSKSVYIVFSTDSSTTYQGFRMTYTFTRDCPLGSYSVSCSKQCYCRLGPCDVVTGTCENGGCKVGWTGIACNETTSIRLINGYRPNQGRLEVFYNNTWGTVCDDGFNSSAAIVVCRMLGFSGNVFAPAALNSTTYGQGTGPIWLDDVRCNGTESSLSYCRTTHWGEHNCGHGEDVGVDCKCGGVLTDPYGVITSPNFPSNYINNVHCNWFINAPDASRINLNITDFAMEFDDLCRHDYLELFNGPHASSLSIGKYCGTVPPMGFKLQSNYIYIVFSTDSSTSYKGFRMTYTFTRDCPQGTYSENCSKQCNCLVGPCDSVTGACGNSICKDGWKGAACNENCPLGSYSVNCSKECHCRFNPCDSVTGECANGGCKDGWKGIACNENCPLGNYSVNCSKQCHCRLGPCDGVTGACGNGVCKDGWTGKACSEKCGGVLTDPIGVITSPNFPNDYNNNERCTWIIKAPEGSQINLNFTDVVMESHKLCRLDHLELFNGPNAFSLSIGKYCGTKPPVGFKSQSNVVCIFFLTDSVSSARGFNLTYTFSVQDCPLGSYSVNCSQQCRCLVGSCDSVTGACGNGVCEDGWKGIACNETNEDAMPLETIVWTAVSSVIGVVMIVGVTVIACVCHERKKKKMAPNAVELNELQSSNSPQVSESYENNIYRFEGLPDDNMYDAIGPCEELVNDERKYDGQGQTKYSDGVLYENDF
ncbi:deleted in malignant brain tumors 1 protein-like isoform X2 [Dreissena polymorpha]|nr:deleted in malignant brain tumors 1 protein-like isoform X2 [Dreissena polymorpha]